MTFLPIVTRELRVASRRGSTYWQRAGAGLGVLLMGTWLYVVMEQQSPRQLSMYLFGALSAGALFYSLLAGLWATADCLSSEKREGTLGLLFLTDLKGYDVIFGKLAATSLNSFYSVVAIVPVMAIPLLMGGLTPGEFGRMALVAINALFFSLAIGMTASSVSRSAHNAITLTALLLFTFSALLPACSGFAAAIGKARRLHELLLLASPGFAYYLAWDAPYRVQGRMFWYSILVTQGIGWAGLALASLIAPRSWQDKPTGLPGLRWRERWRLWAYGNLGEQIAFRRELLNQNAFFWLASRPRLKPALVWAFLGLIACGWVWGLAKFHREWLNESVYVITALIINLIIRVWFAGEAARQLSEERRAGTIELLLSTPLSVGEILQGQFLALGRQFLRPILAILTAEFLFMWGTVSLGWVIGEQRTFWLLLWTAGMAMFLADLVALYWVGMWQGLVARNPSRATMVAVSRILVLPWVVMALLLLVLVLMSTSGLNQFEPGSKFFLGAWFLLGLAADIGFAVHARHKLLSAFRLAVQQRYVSKPVFRWLGRTYAKLKLGRHR